jgi:F-type H+-transporting ATPase subunit delta
MGSARVADFGGDIAERYATAILELAQEENAVPQVERDLLSLESAMAASPDLRRLVRSPIFGRADQAKGMRAVLGQIGASQLTTRFVLVLASKRRLFVLANIIRTFARRLARLRGEVDAKVTSARALSEGEAAELKAAIKAQLGREPRLDTRVDPSLLGGLVVQVGSRMIDTSLRTKLGGIHRAMRGA